MKKLLSLAILGGMLGAPTLWAMQVTTVGGGGYGVYQSGQGGEFTLQVSSDLSWVLDNYSGKTKNVQGSVDTFQTFCVEMHEYIYPNAKYDVQISDTTHFTEVGLTKGAAWLYYEFATGNLSGYDYSPTRSTAGSLQEAIWWMMNQQGVPANNAFATDVLNQFGTSSEAFELNNGAYGVSVLNMWAPGGLTDGEGRRGYERQDQLVLTGVPDGGTTAALLALGFGGLFLVSQGKKEKGFGFAMKPCRISRP